MSFFNIESVNSTIDIEDQQGNPMDLQIEVRPPSDEHVQAVKAAGESKVMEALRKNKNYAAVQREAEARTLAAHVANWTWGDNPRITSADGRVFQLEPKEYSEANALALMKDEDFGFIAAQVREEATNAANFYKA